MSDLRGWTLGVAVVAGAIGAWQRNLAVTAAIALLAVHGPGLLRRVKHRTGTLAR